MASVQSDVVWLDVLPSLNGFSRKLTQGTVGAGKSAGKAVSDELDKAAEDAGKSAGEQLERGLESSTKNVERLGQRLAAARDAQEAAAGRVRITELRLQETLAKGDAPASRVASAEEALATARRKVETTTDGTALALKRYETAQQRAAESADEFGSATKRADGEAESFGGGLDGVKGKIAGFAGALGGIGLAYEGISSTFEQGALGDKLAAQLGAPEGYAADLGRIAGSLYADAYGDSLGTVNDALRGVLQNGVVDEDATDAQIEAITAKVLNLSTTFDQDLGGVTRAVGQAMKTGLAPDANAALDIITRGFQQGADRGEDFLDTLNEYGGQFQKLGIDGATATGLISQGLAAGARDGDKVADAIKEFSIRAIDGSKTTAAAFSGLGLDAQKMSEQIAAGGPAAQAGLGQVLDLLRGVEDPAQRAQIAVGLFGTQSEDLGAALYALDPSQAAGRLGEVAGAADRMGATLNDNAQTKITEFTRSVKQGIVDFLGGQAIPAVQSFTGFLRENGSLILTTATVIGALSAAVAVYSLIQGGATGALGAWILGTGIVRGATLAWAGAQVFLNAVMVGNPLALVVLAIAGLVAAVVIAYQHSETFRAVVSAAWQGIQTAVDAVVTWFVSNALPVILSVWEGIRTGATFLWQNVLSPVFGFIAAAFSVMVYLVKGYWENILQPVFQLVGAILKAVYDNVLSPVLGFIGRRFADVFAAMKLVWEQVLKPVFEALGGFIQDHVAPAFQTGVSAIGTAWDKLKDIARTPVRFVVEKVINEALIGNFNKLADVFGTKHIPDLALPAGFRTGGYTGDDPVDQAVGVVHGQEYVVDAERTKRIGPGVLANLEQYLPGYRTGGIVALGKQFQSMGARVSENALFGGVSPTAHSRTGRHYATPPDNAAIDVNTRGGPASELEKRELAPLARLAESQGFGVYLNTLDFPHYPGHDNHLHVDTIPRSGRPGGGVLGKIGDLASGLFDAISDPASLITGAVDKVIGGVGDSPFGGLVAGAPKLLATAAIDKLKSLAGSIGDFIGGGDSGGPVNQTAAGSGVQRWTPQVLEALHLVGQPDSMLQTTLRRMQKESGGNPRAVNNWDSNAKKGIPSKGLMQVIDPTFRQYALPGHNMDIFDEVSNIAASMRYGIARWGSLPAAYDRAGGYDDGGYLQPGVTAVVNSSGKPEPVFSADQWAVLRQQIGGQPAAPSMPETITVVDADGALIGRMRVEAGSALAELADDAYYARS